MTRRDPTSGIDGIQPLDWSAHFNPKDFPGIDLHKPAGLDIDINPKDIGKSTGFYGHEIISIDPKMSPEGLRLPYDTSPKGIQEINTSLQQGAELKRKREQQEQYERFYFSDSIESLDPKKARHSAVYVEKTTAETDPAPVAVDMVPDTKPAAPKPLAVEEGLKPMQKEAPKKKGLSFNGIIDWVVGIFKPGKKEEAGEAAAPGKAENAIHSVPKLTPPEQANLEKVLKLIEQMNEDLKRIREIEKEENSAGTNPNNAEAYYLSLLVARVKEQVRLKETQMLADNDRMTLAQKEIKENQVKYFNIQKAIAERAKTNKILAWIQFGGTAAIIASVGVSGALFVASFFTAGATLPAALVALKPVFALMAAVGGVAGGSAKIGQSVLEHKTKEQMAEASGLTHEREKAQAEIKTAMQDWTDAMKALSNSWEDINRVIKARQQTISQVMS